jgi:hypothetical protein
MPASLQWENLLKFLAGESLESIVKIVNEGDERFAHVMRRNYARPTKRRRIDPDTPEAADAAAADAALWDAAEAKAAELKRNAPEVWATIVRIIPALTPDIAQSDIRRLG